MNLLLESKNNSTNTKKKKLLRSENVEDKCGDPEEIMSVDGDLVEINDRIICSYGISDNRCPRFFKVCSTIVMFSRLIRHKLIEQGIDRLLDKAEG